jgi:hypothetical protein
VLLPGELGLFGGVDVAVEGKSSVESIAVLAAMVVASQHRVRVPALTVQVGVVGRESAALRLRLGGLEVLVGRSVARIARGSGILEGRVSRGPPISLRYFYNLHSSPGALSGSLFFRTCCWRPVCFRRSGRFC